MVGILNQLTQHADTESTPGSISQIDWGAGLFTIKLHLPSKQVYPTATCLQRQSLFSRSKYKMLLLPSNPILELILLNYSVEINIVTI